MKCEFGKDYTEDQSIGCQADGRYFLQYSVDWKLLEEDPNHSFAADMEFYSCESHLLDMEFIFDPHHGLPQRIFDFLANKDRPDLVRKIENDYEKWRQIQPATD